MPPPNSRAILIASPLQFYVPLFAAAAAAGFPCLFIPRTSHTFIFPFARSRVHLRGVYDCARYADLCVCIGGDLSRLGDIYTPVLGNGRRWNLSEPNRILFGNLVEYS